MNHPKTTNEIRRILEEGGAKDPSRRAVTMVATQINSCNGTTYWELCFTKAKIREAAKACSKLQGEEAYKAFQEELRTS